MTLRRAFLLAATHLAALIVSTPPLSFAAEIAPTVVLIPGSGSSGSKIHVANLNWGTRIFGDRYFGAYVDALTERKIPAYVCPRDEDQDRRTIEERVEDCARFLVSRSGCPKGARRTVILVGHSMGGLVARMLAQDTRVKDCVHSVITVSTPNRGTPIADVAIERAHKDREGFDLFGKLVQFIRFHPDYLHYLPQLRVDRLGQNPDLFRAQDVPDNQGVRYFSVTNSVTRTSIPPLEIGRTIISDELKKRKLDGTSHGVANDGIVPAYSMPHGTVLGNLDVDHWATACLDPVRLTSECTRSKNLLIPTIERLYREITH